MPYSLRRFRQSPIIFAAAIGNIELMDHILARSPQMDFEATDSESRTALLSAIEARRVQKLKWLTDHGASVKFKRVLYAGFTYLEQAIREGNHTIVEILLNSSAKITNEGRIALTEATDQDRPTMVNLLLSHGAKGSIVTLKGEFLVHVAAACG